MSKAMPSRDGKTSQAKRARVLRLVPIRPQITLYTFGVKTVHQFRGTPSALRLTSMSWRDDQISLVRRACESIDVSPELMLDARSLLEDTDTLRKAGAWDGDNLANLERICDNRAIPQLLQKFKE